MRRATGSMMVAWLLATLGAVGVAWVGVHPVADLGLANRPPVPQPDLAESPTYQSNHPAGPARAGSRGVGPATDEERTADPSASPSPSALPTRTPSTAPPSPSPSTSVSPTASPSGSPSDVYYREASTEGGSATFEYAKGRDVYLVEVEPNAGWEVSAYRYYRDWVVVEFSSYDHTSSAHAYLDNGRPRLEVVEEDR